MAKPGRPFLDHRSQMATPNPTRRTPLHVSSCCLVQEEASHGEHATYLRSRTRTALPLFAHIRSVCKRSPCR